MTIALAQLCPTTGNIAVNIQTHLHWVKQAASHNADLILFPELSLTGYEPQLVKELATDGTDPRLSVLQKASETFDMVICVGIPLKTEQGITIGMLVFQPKRELTKYSKQLLHPDELLYFVPGKEQLIIELQGKKLVPAICYEAFDTAHAEKAKELGADIYLASVAKAQVGITNALRHFPTIAQRLKMSVLMSNCLGHCDDFESVGQSAIWDHEGRLVDQLDAQNEGLLVWQRNS